MQSSPYYSNRIFDGKYNLTNIPKYSNNNSPKIVTKTDSITGKTTYSVASESDRSSETTNNSIMNKQSVTDKYVKYLVDENSATNIKTMKDSILNELISKHPTPFTTEFNSYIQEFIKPRTSGKEFIFSIFNPKLTKLSNSKIFENSKIIQFIEGYYIKLNYMNITVNGTSNNTTPLKIDFKLTFLTLDKDLNTKTTYTVHASHIYIRPKSIDTNSSFVMENIPLNIFLPNSNQSIYNFVPSFSISNDEGLTLDMDMTFKTLFNFSYHNELPSDAVLLS
jgi:hypothetical protein